MAAHTRSVPLRQRPGHYHGGGPILAFVGVRQACGSKVVAVCRAARPARAACTWELHRVGIKPAPTATGDGGILPPKVMSHSRPGSTANRNHPSRR